MKQNKINFFYTEAGSFQIIKVLKNKFKSKGFLLEFFNNIPSENIIKKKSDEIWIIFFDRHDHTDKLLELIQKYKCISFGILDAWKGLDRFWLKNGQIKKLPNFLIVPDKEIKRYLSQNKLNTQILVAEHPIISYLKQKSNFYIKKKMLSANKKVNLDKNKKNLIFISEPFFNTKTKEFELMIEKRIVKSNESFSNHLKNRFSSEFNLIYKKHPIENDFLPIGWIDGSILTFEETLFFSDLTIGIGSTFLIYSKLCNKLVDNKFELENWTPYNSNYNNFIWTHLDNNLFKTKNNKKFKSFLEEKNIVKIILDFL